MALEDVFRESIAEFLVNEFTLVRKDAHEQSLCGRLAIYMDRAKERHGYKSHFVDVEYNRRGEGRKQILHPITHQHIDVRCDILLHSRGDLDDDNLIAVEMKKDNAEPEDKQSDRDRLQALTLPMPEGGNPDYVCGYQLAYYLEIDMGNATLLIEEYRGGRMAQRETASSRSRKVPVLIQVCSHVENYDARRPARRNC